MLEHLVSFAEHDGTARIDLNEFVELAQYRLTMGHHNHDGTAFAKRRDRLRKRRLPDTVHVGIGFIKQDKEWGAIDSTGQGNALAFAARKTMLARANKSVIAVGLADNQLMNSRNRRRFEDFFEPASGQNLAMF